MFWSIIDWNFKKVKRKNRGGKPLPYSGLYNLFHSKFYAGIVEWDGKCHSGLHEPMITIKQWQKVQELLNVQKRKPRPKKYNRPFIGIIKCGECGVFVTAETKSKKLKSGNIKIYEYYHCTGNKKYVECLQKK